MQTNSQSQSHYGRNDTNSHVESTSPVHFFSHGSTMMLGEECESASYWKKCGDEAIAHGIKGVVIMVRNPRHSLRAYVLTC